MDDDFKAEVLDVAETLKPMRVTDKDGNDRSAWPVKLADGTYRIVVFPAGGELVGFKIPDDAREL